MREKATYTITGENNKLVNIGLDDSFCSVWVTGDEILHVSISQSSCNCQDAVDAVVQDQTSSIGDSLSFVLIAAFVIVR